MDSTELTRSTDVAALLAHREAVRQKVEQIILLACEVEALTAKGNLGCAQVCLRGKHGHAEPFDYEAVMRAIDTGGWQWLMQQTGLAAFLDATAREEWDRAIKSQKVPPLERDAIVGTLGKVYEDRGAMLERGVMQQFQRLSWDYRTNSPVAFGSKFIMQHLCDRWGKGKVVLSPNVRSCDELDDLERVLHLLDGKPEPEFSHRTLMTMREALPDRMEFETPHLRVRLFLAGTGHVWFKRQQDTDRLNRLIGKVRALASTTRRRS